MSKARVQLWGRPGYVVVDTTPEAAAVAGSSAPSVAGRQVYASMWGLVLEIPANVSGLASLAADGFVRRAGGVISASALTAADLPTLEDTTVGAALLKFTRDAYGRVEGTAAATTDDLAAGSANRYLPLLAGIPDAVDDAAAALAGVAVGDLYRNGSVVHIRVS